MPARYPRTNPYRDATRRSPRPVSYPRRRGGSARRSAARPARLSDGDAFPLAPLIPVSLPVPAGLPAGLGAAQSRALRQASQFLRYTLPLARVSTAMDLWRLWEAQQESSARAYAGGWRIVQTCKSGVADHIIYVNGFVPSVPCGILQIATGPFPFNNNSTSRSDYNRVPYPDPNGYRLDAIRLWRRPAPGPARPWIMPMPDPWAPPDIIPTIAPQFSPVRAPGVTPQPAPLPWRFRNHGGLASQRSYGPRYQSGYASGLNQRPDVVIAPSGVTTSPPKPPGQTNRPRRKERKHTLKSAAGGALAVVGVVTEGLDMLNAFFNALPDGIKRRLFHANGRKHLSPQQKLAAVYKHFDSLQTSDVLLNIVSDQLEDFVIGSLARGAGKHSGKWIGNRGPGLLVGPAL